MKRASFAGAVMIALFFPSIARAYCPSYTPADTAGGQSCGVEPALGTNPTPTEWKAIFGKVSPGQASWGADGPAIGQIGQGCGKPMALHNVDARFPCHVLEAITMQESGWRQFCVPDTPSADVGAPERTIVAFDCGYGVGQVTSGMHVGEAPAFDRARVVSEPTYNLATGTLILADKWRATNCVGDNNPDLVEDWYVAIWAYNGLAYSNNPSNPNLDANRGVYDPSVGGSYTYQERVFGWMEHPPSLDHWPALAPAYPNPGDVGGSGSPPGLPEPSCASPTDCTSARSTHTSVCDGVAPGDDGGTAGGDDGGSIAEAGSPPAGDGGAHPPPIVTGDASTNGAAPAPGSNGDASSGCGCTIPGKSSHETLFAWLLAAASGIAIRSRRGARRSARR